MKRAFTLVEIMIVVVVIGLLAAMMIPALAKVRESRTRQQQPYDVWCKLHPEAHLTYEEWLVARKEGYLTYPRLD